MNMQAGRSLVSKGLWTLFAAAALAGCAEVEPPPSAPQRTGARSMVSGGTETARPTWTITRSGNTINVLRPGKFSMRLATVESTPQGWRIEETNALRARFSSSGPVKNLTVCIDGRAWWDGQYRPIIASADIPAAHDPEVPAILTI